MIHHKGKLIVLEGGDGSGKATQTKLLVKALEKSGTVTTFEFPRYKKSAFGKLIGQCLNGDFGDFLKLSPYLSSLPYILDRARAKYLLLEALKDGHVICDRYTPSNIAFQSAKLPVKERKAFISFLEKGEYEELGLPAPDLVIYLHVPVKVSQKLILQKEKRDYLSKDKKDQYETNVRYQQEVAGVYQKLAKERKNWKVVECLEKGELLSRDAIHKEITTLVKKYLKLK